SRESGDLVTLTYASPRMQAPVGSVPVPLGMNIVTIGRDPASAVRLPNPQVSWHHARVARDVTGAFVLADLGSTNGTYVNFAPFHHSRQLMPGDQLTSAHTSLPLTDSA